MLNKKFNVIESCGEPLLVSEDQTDIKILLDLGLTLLEAKIYYVLVLNGPLLAKEIAQKSGVSRPDVYRTLLKLLNLSLIEKVICKPSKFKAISPENGINILFNRKKNKLEDVETKSKSFIEKFKNNTINSPITFDSNFILLPHKELLIIKIQNAVKKSQKSIDVITVSSRLQHSFNFLSEDLHNAWARGVKGRVIIEKTDANQKKLIRMVWKKPKANLKEIENVPSNIIAIYDKSEVFIFTKLSSDFKESPALWSNNPRLVSLAQFYFETLWLK